MMTMTRCMSDADHVAVVLTWQCAKTLNSYAGSCRLLLWRFQHDDGRAQLIALEDSSFSGVAPQLLDPTLDWEVDSTALVIKEKIGTHTLVEKKTCWHVGLAVHTAAITPSHTHTHPTQNKDTLSYYPYNHETKTSYCRTTCCIRILVCLFFTYVWVIL